MLINPYTPPAFVEVPRKKVVHRVFGTNPKRTFQNSACFVVGGVVAVYACIALRDGLQSLRYSSSEILLQLASLCILSFFVLLVSRLARYVRCLNGWCFTPSPFSRGVSGALFSSIFYFSSFPISRFLMATQYQFVMRFAGDYLYQTTGTVAFLLAMVLSTELESVVVRLKRLADRGE